MISLSDIAIVVNSHARYSLPLMSLLSTLEPHFTQTAVYVAGAETVRSIRYNHVDFEYVMHNSFDFTGMIEYARREDARPYVFFLQDTMVVDIDFYEKIRNINPGDEATAAFGGQCNLVMYRTDYLQKRAHEMPMFLNCSKKQSIDAEGWFWKTAQRKGAYPGGMVEDRAEIFPYSDAPRIREFYHGVGVTKYKANYGQTHEGSYIMRP